MQKFRYCVQQLCLDRRKNFAMMVVEVRSNDDVGAESVLYSVGRENMSSCNRGNEFSRRTIAPSRVFGRLSLSWLIATYTISNSIGINRCIVASLSVDIQSKTLRGNGRLSHVKQKKIALARSGIEPLDATCTSGLKRSIWPWDLLYNAMQKQRQIQNCERLFTRFCTLAGCTFLSII